MEPFDEVSLDYFEPKHVGLVDRERGTVVPIPPPAMRISPEDGGYRIVLTDDRQKQYLLRRLIADKAEADATFEAFSALFEQAAVSTDQPVVTIVADDAPYRSATGVDLTVRVERRWLSPRANYWVYVIYAQRRDTTKQAWTVFIKKAHATAVEQADQIAVGEPLASVKQQLDRLAHGEARPLTVTWSANGVWTLM